MDDECFSPVFFWPFSFSGSTAERINLPAFFVYAFLLTGIMYPVAARWAWHPTGWLKVRGFFDFGGSGVVHMLGGVCALVATLMVGPRIGRFGPKGASHQKVAFRGHSTTVRFDIFVVDQSSNFAERKTADGRRSFSADAGHLGLQRVVAVEHHPTGRRIHHGPIGSQYSAGRIVERHYGHGDGQIHTDGRLPLELLDDAQRRRMFLF